MCEHLKKNDGFAPTAQLQSMLVAERHALTGLAMLLRPSWALMLWATLIAMCRTLC